MLTAANTKTAPANDELRRHIKDLKKQVVRLAQENAELLKQVHELQAASIHSIDKSR